MQLLLIKIGVNGANPEYALLGKKQAEDRYTPGNWKKIRSLSRGRRVLLLVSDNDVVLTTVKIPSKSKKQLAQAVPYALEDSLAEDIENLHFAIHQNDSDGETRVSVINREQLDFYLNLLRKHGITPYYVLPQLLAQTIEKNAWSIYQKSSISGDETSISIRLNDFYGFSCDESLLTLFLEQLKVVEPKIILSNLKEEQLPENLQKLPLKRVDFTIVHYNSVINALPLNLITGFNSSKNSSNFHWKAWRPALVLGGILAATWVGILGWQNNQLLEERNQLNKAIETTFKSTFPESRLVDAPQQMNSKLAALKKNLGQTVDSPLPLIAKISPLLKEYKDMTLSEIRYQENELILVMQSPNLTRLETFKKDAAEKNSLKVDIKSSTTTANKVEATLVISPLSLSEHEQEKT